MRENKILILSILSIVLLSGCITSPENTNTDKKLNNNKIDENNVGSNNYSQTPHIGCQIGEIEKNGTCSVTFSGQNAEIFSVKNLSPIIASEKTLGGIQGYMARPKENGSYPGVIMIHEWWGLNQNIKHMADILAGNGYTVFAVDLYEGEIANSSSRASELAQQVRSNPSDSIRKMRQATSSLRDSSYTNQQVASLGWCFGGGQSFQLSISDVELNATVIYYGTLTTNRSIVDRLDGPVLGIFGEEDQVVNVEKLGNSIKH